MREQDTYRWFLRTMVRKYRNRSGKSQRVVGEEVYRSTDTIRDWELGKTDIPLNCIGDLALAVGMDDELTRYMKLVAEARKGGHPIEASKRLNALFLAAGEECSGYIFKWDPHMIPGPLQLKEYHYTAARKAEPNTDQRVDDGWDFKTVRRETLEARTDKPVVQSLIGEIALIQLRRESEELYQDQLAYLRECAKRPGWEVRVFTEPVASGHGMFGIYERGKSKFAGPPFVYTEVHDSSWLISDPDRITSYHDFRKTRWKRAMGIEDYGNDNRCDRLAQEHPQR